MSERKPNIVLIMTDQQRADFFKEEGFALDTMPFVGSLGEQGVRFERAYTPMPVCAPARCSTFTGRFPKATRVRENGGTRNIFGPRGLTEILREQGYSVCLAGKNHSHLSPEDFDFYAAPYWHDGGPPQRTTSEQRRFDEWLVALDHGVSREPTPFPLEYQLPYRIVSDAIECVDAHGEVRNGAPFFLWLSFPEPHNPYQVPEPYFSLFPEDEVPERVAGPEAAEAKGGKWLWLRHLIEEKRRGYDEEWRRYRANYCGMIRLIDDQIRRFVDYLEEGGLLENTLLVFVSDHGDYAGDYGLQRKGVGMPECLVRVPLIFRVPGLVPIRNRNDFVSLVDIMPTLCETIGAKIPYGVQGRSLWPLLTRQDYPKEEFESVYAELGFGGLPYGEEKRPSLHFSYEGPTFDELNSVTMSGDLKAVRKGRWKLLYDSMGRGELYDLEEDPGELIDLFEEPGFREVRLEMIEELLRWTIRTEDDLPTAEYIPKQAERNWHALYRRGTVE